MANIELTKETLNRLFDLYYKDKNVDKATYGELFDYINPIVEKVVVKHLDEIDKTEIKE